MENKNDLKKAKGLNDKTILLIQFFFIMCFISINLFSGIFPSMEILFALCLLIFIWRSKDRKLLVALLPFCILILTFQSLRGFADNLSPSRIHITDLIAWEKLLFNGWIPAYVIQKYIPTLPGYHLISGLCNLLYIIHFVTPVLVAIFLWYKNNKGYWYFVGGITVITYVAFIVYYLFPAAPPWWATQYGYLLDQPVYLTSFFYYPALITNTGPNPVAAMPSLHMAYPTFIALMVNYYWPKKATIFYLLPIMVGFSTLLLGHHYIIDLIAGVVLSVVVFVILKIIIKRKATRVISKSEEIIQNQYSEQSSKI